MSLALALAATLGCRPAATAPTAQATSDASTAYVPFAERKAAHTTTLSRHGPSTGRYDPDVVPADAKAVHYPSGEHELLAWLALPPDASEPVPALVYFHGAFSLVPEDFEAVRPFLDAGLAVLTPTLRGENGNPGHLELLYGEVDDAAAAIRWLAAQPEIDGDRIHVIGHSIGGAISALVSLDPSLPLRQVGSVGGIYVPATFVRWRKSSNNAHLVRFDPEDPMEGSLRTLGANVRDLAHPHIAYIGEDDTWFHPNVEAVAAEAERFGAPFTVQMVPGDHMSSLDAALADFLERVQADAAASGPAPAASVHIP
ncbi:MAG: alpha/beta fold hydrolase [Deltaproteobacteria bacterium]|nr:alpha/beta fold hydrolase [Deltaproteobacteria bacterium]